MRTVKSRLYAPGPVEVPPQVLAATARPLIHHRTAEFKEMFLRTREKLAQVAMVPGEDVLILAGSGTAGFEAGLLACVPKGSKVVGVNAGKFGERWVKLAQQYGYEVAELKLDWGRAADPEVLREFLQQHPDAKAVTTTHSETSTGVLHDVEALAAVVHSEVPGALFLVDTVTSLGVAELRPKAWGLDGIFSGSQKGLMTPPGLAFAWLSERAWARREDLNPTFYLDLHKERRQQQQGQTAQTPAVTLILGLEVALDMLLAEGTENVWQRRETLNQAIINAGVALGCQPYAERPSAAVAALVAPEGVAAPDIVRGFAERGLRIAGGQDHAKAVLFRPSMMGYADRYDAITVVAALEEVLASLGHHFTPQAGLKAALETLG